MIKNKKGFTLIEVIVAMLVTGIILSAVYFVFIKSFLMSQGQAEFINAQDAIRTSALMIESDIRKSSQSIETEANGTCTTITDTITNDTFEYCVQDSKLIRNGNVLIDHVKSIEFDNQINYVSFEITGQYQGKEIKHEKRIYLRNP